MVQKEAMVSEVLKAGAGVSDSGVPRVSVRWHEEASDCWAPAMEGEEYVLFVQKRFNVAFISACSTPITPAEVPEVVLKRWRAAG